MLTLRFARLVGMGLLAAQVGRFAGEERFLDDAWISFRVARNLLEHGVLTFDATQPPVEGATNLAWVLLSAAQQAALPGLEPALFARLLGMLCLGGILWIWTGVAARRTPDNPGVAALVVAVLVGAAGNLAFHALGGLETGLYALCFAGGLAWLWPDPEAPAAPIARPAGLGALLALLAATRPEGVLLGGLLLALGWRRPGVALAAAVFAAGVGAMEGFRLYHYGALVPNTFHAKPPNADSGLRYLGQFAGAVGFVGIGAALALARERAWRGVIAVAAIMLAGAAWSGGDWMPGYRRLVEPFLVIVLAAGVAAARSGGLRVVGAVSAAALVAGAGWQAWSGADGGRYGHRLYGQVGELLAATPGVDTVAAVDIGRLGWYYPGSIVDLVGLTDATLARGFDAAYLDRRDPDIVLIMGNTAAPADLSPFPGLRDLDAPALAWARASGRYRLHTALPMPGGTAMSVLVRRDVTLSVDLWGAPSNG